MGGYGPPTTGFCESMKFIGDKLAAQFGDRVDVKYVWNIMDFGYKAEEILWLVESGMLTLGYQSSSYLTDRVPELSFVDLPFLFATTTRRARAMDGALGRRLVQAIESKANFRILGWYENGFRHISNRVRTVRTPADLKGIRIRVLPSQIQARTFELLGAKPMIMDLTDAIRMIKAGEIDAQENPLTNTVTYGVHKFHRFHTISNHFYISRPIFLHRPTFDGWPADLKAAMQSAVDGVGRVPARAARQGGRGRRARDQGRGLRDRRRSTPSSTTPSPPRCSRSTPRRASSWATSCSTSGTKSS